MVHIVTGSAGCQEDHNPFIKDQPYYSAFRALDYGYSHMTIHNSSHLTFQQISDDQVIKNKLIGKILSMHCMDQQLAQNKKYAFFCMW